MITPDSPDRSYSTRLRTALLLTGSGTAGAYHAGVLRALHEAGVKVDLVGGRGIGAASALFAAIDGSARLWEPAGIWKDRTARQFYGWRRPLRLAGYAALSAGLVLLLPVALLAAAVLTGIVGLILSLVGLEAAGASLTARFTQWVTTLFSPWALPTVVPRLVLFALIIGAAILAGAVIASYVREPLRRRSRSGVLWRLFGAPLSSESFVDRCAADLWNLIRGAAPIAAPGRTELARKYVELLSENQGQPGFRELLITAHDLDARRDLVFAFLAQARRGRFFSGTPAEPGARPLEAFDVSGVARDHVLDAVSAALSVPLATEPYLVRFPAEGPWRGEAHRLCDRPEGLSRLIEEAAHAGAEQIILVSAAPQPARAHELSGGRADMRGRAGEQLLAFETASLRDALEQFTGRFASLFVVRPEHNPLTPLDFGGVYDERSDRIQRLAELVDRGYEDAYRQFIGPIVGAGAEPAEPVQQLNGGQPAPSRL
ncbi:MAG TPA: patatin-like phospholipase family protein [Vicinamibacterales bacterium]|nr:patatin-like phospholipase family protein [Vicinamibacterales bacterium]